MARGTQHRKRRPPADARVAATPQAKAKAKQRVKHSSWEDELFFARIRAHAKWVFVLLAIAFGLGFVIFGVGSGSTGISDVLQSAFQGGGSSGGSVSGLRKKVREHPKDAKAWHELATKLAADQKIPEAIGALERYTALRPKDASGLEELAGLYSRQADEYRTQAATAQTEAQTIAPGSVFRPASTTPLGRAYQDPTALGDPISRGVSDAANAKASDAYSKLSDVEKDAEGVYKKLIALNPEDATRQIQLGQAAEAAGDTKTALSAYKKFLELAPNDPLAPAVKEHLKQLTGSTTPTVSTG